MKQSFDTVNMLFGARMLRKMLALFQLMKSERGQNARIFLVGANLNASIAYS